MHLSVNSMKASRENIDDKKVNAQEFIYFPQNTIQQNKFIDQNYRCYSSEQNPGAKLCSIDHDKFFMIVKAFPHFLRFSRFLQR